jgi:hypothetical protein
MPRPRSSLVANPFIGNSHGKTRLSYQATTKLDVKGNCGVKLVAKDPARYFSVNLSSACLGNASLQRIVRGCISNALVLQQHESNVESCAIVA